MASYSNYDIILGSFIPGYNNMKELELSSNMFNEQLEFNRVEAEKNRQWQEMMQDKMNAYNSPVAQMQRLKDAGLNPALMYGGNGMISESAVPPSGSQASGSSGSVPSLSSFDPNVLLTFAQIRDLNASASLKTEQAQTESALRQSRLQNLNAATEHLSFENKNILSQIDLRLKQGELTDAQRNDIKFDQVMRGKSYRLDVQRVANETGMTEASIKNMNANTELALAKAKVTNREYQEMIYTFSVRAAGLQAQVNLTKAMEQQALATANKLGLEASILTPEAINAEGWASDMSGKNGKFNEVGSNIAYQIKSTIKELGGILLK